MNNQFDELTKGLAQSVTRRAALKKFGVGLAGMALACFGVVGEARAAAKRCTTNVDCPAGTFCYSTGVCVAVNCQGLGARCERGSDCCSGHCVKRNLGSFGTWRVCVER